MFVDISVPISRHFNLFFAECTSGTYGVNCEYSCDACVRKLCDSFDGKCTYGCIEGFNGDHCNLTGIPILVQGTDLSYCNAHLDLFS